MFFFFFLFVEKYISVYMCVDAKCWLASRNISSIVPSFTCDCRPRESIVGVVQLTTTTIAVDVIAAT